MDIGFCYSEVAENSALFLGTATANWLVGKIVYRVEPTSVKFQIGPSDY